MVFERSKWEVKVLNHHYIAFTCIFSPPRNMRAGITPKAMKGFAAYVLIEQKKT